MFFIKQQYKGNNRETRRVTTLPIEPIDRKSFSKYSDIGGCEIGVNMRKAS